MNDWLRVNGIIGSALGGGCFGGALGECIFGDGPAVFIGAAIVAASMLAISVWHERKTRNA